MKKFLILATGGAGGDLQPLVAAVLGLRQRGHPLTFLGDESVANVLQPLGIETVVLSPEHDLGPRIIAAVRDSQGLAGPAQGEFVERRLSDWAKELAHTVQGYISTYAPDLLLTSLFGAGVAHLAASERGIPWSVINSTFYLGPNPPRPLEQDMAPRAIPLFRDSLIPYLEHAQRVLHATDAVFDYHHSNLPPRHHYVGPLIWEAAAPRPTYLDEPGAPWVLVTLSSQMQDDVPLARTALAALAELPVRALVTIGGGHQPAELDPLPKNARVEHYVPHAAVLQRSQLLLSHAGHGAVMKALWHGVPMVLAPWGRDQPGVAARAEHLGVARVIARDQLTASALAEAIRVVMADPGYRNKASEFSLHLKEQDPVATACKFLEQV
jgi:UDP:flavonoid glycosyltransferase YjiC (YdhE family)